MTGSTLRRATTLCAFALLAAGAVAGTAEAAPTTATSLSIRSLHDAVDPQGSDTISGVLDAGQTAVAGQPVLLESRAPGGSFSQIGSQNTGNDGSVAFTVTPAGKTDYELVYSGNDTYQPSQSAVVTVNVRTPTSLSIRSSKSLIDPGQSDSISGTLLNNSNAPLAGQSVQLQSHAPGKAWSIAVTKTTDGNGFVAFTVSPRHTTLYMLVFRATNDFSRSHSGVVTLRVRRAASLSIRIFRSSINPGGTDAITGVLRVGSTTLGNRTVLLQSRPGSNHDWQTVQSKQTGAHGFVRFLVSPKVTKQYRLVFRTTQNFYRAISAVVTVIVRKPSSLSIRSAHDTLSQGQSDTISGVLLGAGHPLADRTVVLYERKAGARAWAAEATQQTGSNGGVSFTVTPPNPKEQYMLVFHTHPYYLPCHSGVVTVSVS
jgi:5-hydroxyisourate hydrolase-like protein (transthyretin family)